MTTRSDSSFALAIPPLLLSGLDTLEVAYFLDVSRSLLDFIELESEQQKAKADKRKGFAELELGTETFALRPYGRKPYSYVLANEDFEVRLAEFMKPACAVRFSSNALWAYGLNTLVSRFADWCRSMDLVATLPERVSRADWAFDFHLSHVDFSKDQFVTRVRKAAVWYDGSDIQTFHIGKGDAVIRVYDKVAEINQQSAKAFFFDLWGRKDEVWRVEFQVRSDRLREGGIRTIDDLKSLQSDLLRELATNHTTLRLPTSDSNRSRWETLHPLWQSLQEAIAELPQTGLVRAIDPKSSVALRLYFQTKSVYGYMKGIAALAIAQGKLSPNPELPQVVAVLRELFKEHHQPDIWAEDVAARLTALRLGQW